MSLHCNGCDGYECDGIFLSMRHGSAPQIELIPFEPPPPETPEGREMRLAERDLHLQIAGLKGDNAALRRRIVELGEEMRAERGNASDVPDVPTTHKEGPP